MQGTPTKRVGLTAFINLREGSFLLELNEREARALMGIEHPIVSVRGKVDARWALDKASKDLGLDWETLVGKIEGIAKTKKRIKELRAKCLSAAVDQTHSLAGHCVHKG